MFLERKKEKNNSYNREHKNGSIETDAKTAAWSPAAWSLWDSHAT